MDFCEARGVNNTLDSSGRLEPLQGLSENARLKLKNTARCAELDVGIEGQLGWDGKTPISKDIN